MSDNPCCPNPEWEGSSSRRYHRITWIQHEQEQKEGSAQEICIFSGGSSNDVFDLSETEIRTSLEVGLELFLDLVSCNGLVNILKKTDLKNNHSKVVLDPSYSKTILSRC